MMYNKYCSQTIVILLDIHNVLMVIIVVKTIKRGFHFILRTTSIEFLL